MTRRGPDSACARTCLLQRTHSYIYRAYVHTERRAETPSCVSRRHAFIISCHASHAPTPQHPSIVHHQLLASLSLSLARCYHTRSFFSSSLSFSQRTGLDFYLASLLFLDSFTLEWALRRALISIFSSICIWGKRKKYSTFKL